MKGKVIFKKINLFKIIFCLFSLTLFNNCHLIPCTLDSGLTPLIGKQKDDFFKGEYMVDQFVNNSYNINIDNLTMKIDKNSILEINNIHGHILNLRLNKKINVKAIWKPMFFKEKSLLTIHYKFAKKDSIENYLTSWKVYKKNNKPVLLINIGDPDECTAIRFIKK